MLTPVWFNADHFLWSSACYHIRWSAFWSWIINLHCLNIILTTQHKICRTGSLHSRRVVFTSSAWNLFSVIQSRSNWYS